MSKPNRLLLAALLSLGLAALVTSCYKGPAERTGEKIDNAAQSTRDAVRDTARDAKHDMDRK